MLLAHHLGLEEQYLPQLQQQLCLDLRVAGVQHLVVGQQLAAVLLLGVPKGNQLLHLLHRQISHLAQVHAEPEQETLLEIHDDKVVVVKKFAKAVQLLEGCSNVIGHRLCVCQGKQSLLRGPDLCDGEEGSTGPAAPGGGGAGQHEVPTGRAGQPAGVAPELGRVITSLAPTPKVPLVVQERLSL